MIAAGIITGKKERSIGTGINPERVYGEGSVLSSEIHMHIQQHHKQGCMLFPIRPPQMNTQEYSKVIFVNSFSIVNSNNQNISMIA